MSYKVVFTDPPFQNLDLEKDILNEVDADIINASERDEDLLDLVKDADAIVVTYEKLGNDFINSLKNCKIISRTGIGVDNIDIDSATDMGIYVTNVPDYCIEEVSTHALSLILAILRNIPVYDKAIREGKWDTQIGRQLYRITNLNLGIIGLGKIGRKLTEKGNGIGFDNVIGFDPYLSREEIKEIGAKPVEELEELLAEADVISVHVPLNDETRGLIGKEELNKMKKDAIIVNTSRGGIIEEKSLKEALKENKISVALDVFKEEPPNLEDSLFDFENAVFTPHTGWISNESRKELRKKATEQVKQALAGEEPNNVINVSLSE